MTISERRWLRISISTLGFLVAGAVFADRAQAQAPCSAPTGSGSCVPLTLTANVQITRLHPLVTTVQLVCKSQVANGVYPGASSGNAVVNRGYTGPMTATMQVAQWFLNTPANRTVPVICELQLINGNTPKLAIASATQPETITDSNWDVVATGSTIKWTGTAAFP